MFELFADDTPNARKVSIMLEEIQAEYKVTLIDIGKGDQFKDDFKKISPFNKIPVLRNSQTGQSYFESGAILIYLAEQSGKFYNDQDKTEINQWLMAQMGYVGPMLGQHHQFHHYNPGKSEFGEKRYFKISERIYNELNINCLPVTINSGEMWPKNGKLNKNKNITITILKPIKPGLESKEFLDSLQSAMYEVLNKTSNPSSA